MHRRTFRLLSLPLAICVLIAAVPPAGRANGSAIHPRGQAWSWGTTQPFGARPQTGRPVPVRGLSDVVAIAAAQSSLAVRADGTVRGWGPNGSGQLGNGTRKSSAGPVKVHGLGGVTAVAAGDDHSLALRRDGTVWAWGNNASGQLGNGTTRSSLVPVRVRGLTRVVGIAAPNTGWMAPLKHLSLRPAASTHAEMIGGYSMALRSDGTVWVWGDNYFNFTNRGGFASSVPRRVHGLSRVVAIAAGAAHALALLRDGTVRAWGSDTFDQLGSDHSGNQGLVRVHGLRNVISISAGAQHSLALERDGRVWTWGRDVTRRLSNGQIERCGSNEPCSSVAVPVAGISHVVAIAAGGYHDLALRSDGTLWGWGDNSAGQLGSGESTQIQSPRRVALSARVLAIAAGWSTSLAITEPVNGSHQQKVAETLRLYANLVPWSQL